MQLVIVEWRDIIATAGWEPKEEVKCPVIRSVGWLIPGTDNGTIKICNTLAPEDFDEKKDDKEYGITAFPKGCVTKLEFLSYEVSNITD
jgi:hypothetical protein